MNDQPTPDFAAAGQTAMPAGEPRPAKWDGRATMEQAKEIARNVGEQAKSAAASAGTAAQDLARRATASAGTAAQDLARRAREQTGVASDTLYEQGTRAGEYLADNVNRYPLAALLIAAGLGYGMAYLIHSRWQG